MNRRLFCRSRTDFCQKNSRQQMEDYGFSISRWQKTDSILSTINYLQTLYLFRFNIDIPVAAIDDRRLQAATKHGRSRTRKVCLVLMLTKICGDKTFRNRDPSWFFFLLGDTWPAFSRVSLSRSMGEGRREPWDWGWFRCPVILFTRSFLRSIL